MDHENNNDKNNNNKEGNPQVLTNVREFLGLWATRCFGSCPQYIFLQKSKKTQKRAEPAALVQGCLITDQKFTVIGRGASRKAAKTDAAAQLCRLLVDACQMTRKEFESMTVHPLTKKERKTLKNAGIVQREHSQSAAVTVTSEESSKNTLDHRSRATPPTKFASVSRKATPRPSDNMNSSETKSSKSPVAKPAMPRPGDKRSAEPSEETTSKSSLKKKKLANQLPNVKLSTSTSAEAPPIPRKNSEPASVCRSPSSETRIETTKKRKVDEENSTPIAAKRRCVTAEDRSLDSTKTLNAPVQRVAKCVSNNKEQKPTCRPESNTVPKPEPSFDWGKEQARGAVAGTMWGLSQEIETVYNRLAQNEYSYNSRMAAVHQFNSFVKAFYGHHVQLFLTGSMLSGLCDNDSDLDMMLGFFERLPSGEELVDTDRQNALRRLRHLRNVCCKRLYYSLFENIMVVPAKVPILRLKFSKHCGGYDADLNINNFTGVRNSYLLHYYTRIDSRFAKLALVIKTWAVKAGIKDSINGMLSSYALNLLILHYLQYGVLRSFDAPVLPNLQALYPQLFNSVIDVRCLSRNNELPFVGPYPRNTDATLAELMLGFFRYYGEEFDFLQQAISIRRATALPKFAADWDGGTTAWISIEEPFDLTSVARTVIAPEKFELIWNAFKEANRRLSCTLKMRFIGLNP